MDKFQSNASATSRSAGLIIQPAGTDRKNVTKTMMAQQTLKDIRAFEEAGDDLGFRQVGTSTIALKEQPAYLGAPPFSEQTPRALAAEIRMPNVPSWINLAPGEGYDGLEVTSFVPDDGYIDPIVLAGAYLSAARAVGARTLYDVEYHGTSRDGAILWNGSEKIDVHCPVVIDCGGVWAGFCTARAGLHDPLPMAPTRSHYWTLRAGERTLPGNQPMTIIPHMNVYTRPQGDGQIVLGIQEQDSLTADARSLALNSAGHEGSYDSCAEMMLVDHMEHLLPYFRGARS